MSINSSYESLIGLISGKSVAVLGLGVSNTPLVRLLLSLNVARSIFVYDKKQIGELGEDAEALLKAGVIFKQGFDDICEEVIFRSPGIRPDIPSLECAYERGAAVTSEIEQLIAASPASVFAITGSDGKTTTTTLSGKFLAAKGECFVGGNIGTPLLDRLNEMRENDSVVLELSSFQLMDMKSSPCAAVITNLTPNHLDWHTSLDEYEKAKHNIVGENTKRVVLNLDNCATRAYGNELIAEGGREIIFFSSTAGGRDDLSEQELAAKLVHLRENEIVISDNDGIEPLLSIEDIMIPGKHNIENYMAAIALTYNHVQKSVYSSVAREFFGVEHRLQKIRSYNGVDFFNSSIDSSPTRTAAALSALEGRDIVIICGGYDKNLDYAPLAEALCRTVRVAVLTGATAEKIEKAILDCPNYPTSGFSYVMSKSFEDAFEKAVELGREGGCVLLSPASASFDRFRNFMERGEYFVSLVNGL